MNQVTRRSFLSGGLGAAAAGALFMMGCAKDGKDSGNSATPAADVQWDYETDVLVVGFGGAGASAAINASDAGANVLIIEHAPEGQEGGNTSVSGGGSNTNYARPDNREFMYANFPDVIKHEEIDSVLEELAGTREWMESHGAKIAETIYGPAFVFVGGNGYALFQWLKETAINSPGVQVMYSTPGKRLIFDPVTKEVYGVVAEQNGKLINIKAKRGVVMACGGFEADHYKMTAYLPAGFPFFTAGTPYNTGLGLDMVQEVGAKLRGFGSVEYDCHCCKKGSEEIGVALAHSFQNPNSWCNAIMVNGKGKRFVNETFGGRYAEGQIQRPLHAEEQIPELAQ
ncbi:MAG: FAD-binding protein [Eggerthellaceae bacterium]|nr:FAD-binding protein [Eggerthellaceae bacterium]